MTTTKTPAAKPTRIKWACPKCGAGAHKHGKGGKEKCLQRGGTCEGMICECDLNVEIGKTHGQTLGDPCTCAKCYHCGWGGKFPTPPKAALPWERKALAAGWTPPAGWAAGRKL